MADPTSTLPVPLWCRPDFRLLLGGRLVSQLGDSLQFLALPLLVIALTGSSTQAGLLLGLQTVVHLVFGLLAGALVDRWDRRTTMIWCEIGRGSLTATIPVAAAFGALGMPQLYAVAVLNGVLGTLFGAANSSALPNIVPSSDLPAALGAVGAMSNALRLVGAAMAGVAYAVSRMFPFVFNAVSFLVSAAFLRAIRTDFQQVRTTTPGSPRVLLTEIGHGLAWLWRKPVIRTLALLDAADSLRYGAGYLLIIMLAQDLHANPAQVGMVFAGAGVGALLGSLLAPALTRRFPLGALSITMLWAEALAFPFYAVAPTWWLLLVVAFTESVLSPVYNVALDSYRLAVTPDALRGRVTSAVDTLTTGGAAIGTIASGALIALLGPTTLTLVLAGWLTLLALAATLSRTVRTARVTA
ncbi:MFS transporter [Micromonospora endolithica]|uniref:MFS transporter n=1 Tax=Micromonospora endolithica TaxID=230091 RepID=A0A3A9ZS34_9ACTN|nr:MFS transporter [Micromonospora endolithica]RKN50943.1 MFS transporter [Micromonospora endolithica]TWJ20279.1 putative MFS family arabinose efflux permease [Micromonospora endolithica]